MSLEFHNREVHINAIRIPWDTLPGADKIAKCYGFYKEHGFLDRVIVIDGQYWLRDGLAGLMVARAVGLKRVKVLQVTEKKDKPEAKPEVKAKTEAGTETEVKPESQSKTEEFLQALPDFQVPKEVEKLTKLRVLCVESYKGLILGQTRGKVYEFDEGMWYDDSSCHRANAKPPFTFGAWRQANATFARFVVPLIHRPAKIGEWVRVRVSASTGGALDGGDICQVISRQGDFPAPYGYVCVAGKKYVSPGQHVYLSPNEYDVLEGYDGRFEPSVGGSVPPAQRIEAKTPCDCYHERESGPHGVTSECWGTREREECSCHGYKELCTFYPERRKTDPGTGGSHETEV